MIEAVVLELNDQIIYKLHLTVNEQIFKNNFLIAKHFIYDLILYLSR